MLMPNIGTSLRENMRVLRQHEEHASSEQLPPTARSQKGKKRNKSFQRARSANNKATVPRKENGLRSFNELDDESHEGGAGSASENHDVGAPDVIQTSSISQLELESALDVLTKAVNNQPQNSEWLASLGVIKKSLVSSIALGSRDGSQPVLHALRNMLVTANLRNRRAFLTSTFLKPFQDKTNGTFRIRRKFEAYRQPFFSKRRRSQ